MSVSPASVADSIERELATLNDSRIVDHIRGLLVAPKCEMRAWDYGSPGESFPCWIALAHKPSNRAIAYCEHGFGPTMPWGLLFLEGKYMSMGMDSAWFPRFLEAYFDSAATDLAIWRVFQHRGADFPGKPISEEGTWESTWAEVMRLRNIDPASRYDCWQSIYDRGD